MLLQTFVLVTYLITYKVKCACLHCTIAVSHVYWTIFKVLTWEYRLLVPRRKRRAVFIIFYEELKRCELIFHFGLNSQPPDVKRPSIISLSSHIHTHYTYILTYILTYIHPYTHTYINICRYIIYISKDFSQVPSGILPKCIFPKWQLHKCAISQASQRLG